MCLCKGWGLRKEERERERGREGATERERERKSERERVRDNYLVLGEGRARAPVYNRKHHLVPGFGFRFSGSGFWVPGFGFQFSVFGFRPKVDTVVRCNVNSRMFRPGISRSTWPRVSGFRFRPKFDRFVPI